MMEPGSIQSGESDVCFVIAEVIDDQGRINPAADHTIFFTARGDGKIAAVGSGDPTSTEAYTGNQRKAFHGRCLVALRSDGNPGKMHLSAQADGLLGAEVEVEIV